MINENLSLIDELRACGAWFDALSCQHERLERIDAFLRKKETEGTVYPPRGLRLNALRHTPLNNVKAVIVAQDPYPSEDNGVPNAMGLALSVWPGVKVPASLRNMYKELERSLNIPQAEHGDLSQWAGQGLLLWNVLLTLDAGVPKSHKGTEWQAFTDAVLQCLCENNKQVVFLSFGRDSHAFSGVFEKFGNPVIKTSHPSPLGARKAAKDGSFVAFMGSGCFAQANDLLKQAGREPMNWNLT
tara:strand:- start:448 stop:1176 length:729 start_codon:yes stop_codon:yes gene_type:complete